MAGKFAYRQVLEIHAPKVDLKGQTAKYKSAVKRAITRGLQRSSSYVAKGLGTALDTAVESSVWSWPRETFRQNGDIAGQTRDIVDTGRLKSKREIKESFAQSKATLTIKYATPYAAIVRSGGVIQPYGNKNAATVILPGRPWIEATLKGTHGIQKYDMTEDMNKGFAEVWNSQFG